MPISTKAKILISVGAVLTIIAIVTPILVISLNNRNSNGNAVELTLLANAGVMIEAKDMRIYIDPIDLPSSYSSKPADVILITHNHGDHYQQDAINLLQKEGTANVFPEIMAAEIALHDGTGIVPEDELVFGSVTITTFYMYTLPPSAEYPASHPKESNYTSYIIDIDGFTIFHAGDSKNIPEYEELAGIIDVALLPLGPGCQTMTDMEVVDVLEVIDPRYFIPIHYSEGANDSFVAQYGALVNISTTNCEICNLQYFSSRTFQIT